MADLSRRSAAQTGPEIDWKAARDDAEYLAGRNMGNATNLARAGLAMAELIREMAAWIDGARVQLDNGHWEELAVDLLTRARAMTEE